MQDMMVMVWETATAKGLGVGDLALVAVLFIVWPLVSSISMWKNPPGETAPSEAEKLATYRYTFWTLWIVAGAVVGWWAYAARPFAELGFRFEWTMAMLFVCIAAGLAIVYGAVELVRINFSEAKRAELRSRVADMKYAEQMVPVTAREHRRTMGLSVTAGITEEIIFRGYLIWVLSLFMHPWAAGAVSAALFIFQHRYQGLAGMTQVAMITSVLTVLYLAGGSLLPVIILHILVDVLALTCVWIARRDAPDAASLQEASS